MTAQQFEVVIRATAEVRDVDGNLVSAEPVEFRNTMTEAEVKALTEGDAS